MFGVFFEVFFFEMASEFFGDDLEKKILDEKMPSRPQEPKELLDNSSKVNTTQERKQDDTLLLSFLGENILGLLL